MQIYNFHRLSGETVMKNNENVKCKEVVRKRRSKGTQTKYRDSEAQTDPWEPPLRLRPGANPELSTLTYLRWGNGLPVGQREIEKIKRMRTKNAWEALLSPVDCTDRKTQEFIISVIDQEEWAFRDKELERTAHCRLDEMKDLLKSLDRQRELVLAERFEKVGKYLNEMREKKIDNIKKDFCRNLRKLSSKYCTKNVKHPLDLKKSLSKSKIESNMKFEFDSDKFESNEDLKDKESSEDFNEENSKSYKKALGQKGRISINTRDISEKPLTEKIDLSSLLKYDKKSNLLTKYLSKNPLKIEKRRARMPDELCIRETRWTDEQLRKLHDDLKKIRLNVIEKSNLPSRKCKIHPLELRKMSRGP